MKNNMILRRTFCLLLVSLLVFSLFSTTSVLATGETKIILGETFGEIGAEVVVPVTVKNNPGMASFRFRISYDVEGLEFISVTKGTLLTLGTLDSTVDSNTKAVTFQWFSTENIVGDGEIAQLKFRILKGGCSDYSLAVTYLENDIVNEDLETISYSVVEGKILIDKHLYDDVCDIDCNICEKIRILEGIDIISTPTKKDYLEGKETLDVSAGKIALYYDDKSTGVIDITPDMISGFDNTKVGTQELIVSYRGKTTTFTVEVTAKALTSIAVTTKPNKFTYLEGDNFDKTGMVVTAYYNNDTSAVVTDYTVSGYSSTPGTKTITVSYGGKSATFTVEVTAKALTSIAVTTKPNKLTYLEGDSFDKTGMVVTAYYDNDTSAVVTDYTVSGYSSTPGTKTITVSYGGKSATFTVEVAAVVVAKDGWVQENGKWYYYINGEKFKNDWMLDSVGWCYLTEDGSMATNEWILDSVGWCYVGENGYCVTDTWKQDSKGWCYLNSEGRMATNTWILDSVGWCYVGSDGYCVTNTWMADSVGWVYLDSEGRMKTNAWVMDSVGWCYVGSDGYAVTNCWKSDSSGWCYLDAEGRMVTNGYVYDSNGKCWLDKNGYWDGIYR